jgi:hypothetical protein
MCVRLIALLLALAASALTHASISDDPELDPAWKLITDRNGIQVYMRHRDDSRLKTFRGVTRIRLSDEYALAALMEDYPSYPRWLHFIDGATEFRRDGPLLRYLRFTTQLPWPLNDREAVLQARVSTVITPELESITVYLDNRPNMLPPTDRYVRFPEMEGIFQITRLADDEAQVIYQLVLDPGGYIPAWLANVLLRDAPYFTLERLRRIITRPEYQNRYFDYVELRGPGRPGNLLPPRSYIYGNPPDAPLIDLQPSQANPVRPQ